MSLTAKEQAAEFERLDGLFNEGKAADFLPEEFKFYHDKLLEKWEAANQAMQTAKVDELDYRNKYVKLASDPNKKKGTQNIELANGYKAKIVKKINYNVNQETVNEALDKLENLDAEGKFISERLVTWKASLSVSEYDSLLPKYKAIIDEVITTSDGTPSLEIVAPADKKKR